MLARSLPFSTRLRCPARERMAGRWNMRDRQVFQPERRINTNWRKRSDPMYGHDQGDPGVKEEGSLSA